MTELSPDNYKEVIKKANAIRNKNMLEKWKKRKLRRLQKNNGSISGIDYFRDKIDNILKRSKISPKMTEMLNKEHLEDFLKGENKDGISKH